jgi:FkbM family methyltransferase
MKSILKRAFVRMLRSRGWIAVPEWRMSRLPLEEHLKQLFADYQVDCVLDVGANAGQFRDLLRDGIGYEGPVLSFEPVRGYVEELRKRAASDPAWRIFPWALGSEAATKTITLLSSPGLPSLLAPDLAAMHNLLPRADTTITGTEDVTVRRLDEIFSEATAGLSARRVYLKIDTQGYDMEVIKGAGSILNVVSALQTELSVLPLYRMSVDYQAALSMLSDRGFAISGMFPVTHDRALRIIEMDCVMVRNASPQTHADP